MAPGQTAPRTRLLEAALDHLADHGTHDLSLRGLAAALGTSHRMLSYHFGSRDGLLVAVAQAVEQRQRAAFADLLSDPDATPVDVIWRMYRRITDPALWPQERLFFDLYARGLQGSTHAEPVLEGAVETWLQPLAELFGRLGFDAAQSAAEARLALAVARGLLLDLLATRDHDATRRAMERYVARYE